MNMPRTLLLLLAAALAPTPVATADEAAIDDFEGPIRWQKNRDGGTDIKVARDAEHVKHGKAALRLTYTDAPPHWSNLRGSVTVPPDASAVAVWLYVHSADPAAAMHLWLLEDDGDAWVARLGPADKAMSALGPGWHEVVVPVAAFRFEPRGRRTPRMTSANAMLIGCNFANLDVTIDQLRFILSKEPGMTSLAKTPDLRIQRGKAGSVAILSDDFFGQNARTPGAADPKRLAALAEEMGFGATMLKSGDAADAGVLNRRNFDVLVVPCAPAYPRRGRDALLAFLKGGGALVSVGGYAFDSLLYKSPDGWAAADPATRARDLGSPRAQGEGINTRYGRPGDTMGLKPDQVGAFDPAFLLQDVAYAATAPDQDLLQDDIRIDPGAPGLAGYAACAMTGSNSPVFPDVYGRWVPILNCYDRFGRLRGAAGAVVHHWAGPFAGSSWAIFGVTNRDLFADAKSGPALFGAALRAVTHGVYLHGPKTDLACYRPGEPVHASVAVTNRGPAARSVILRLRFQNAQAAEKRLTVEPGKTQTIQADVRSGEFPGDFCTVAAELLDAETNQPLDRTATGLVVWSDEVIRSGPKIAFRDNYFTVDGAATLLCGSNQTGMMWYSQHEDPLVWQRDFARMQAAGMRMLRILHFSPFAASDPPRWGAEGGIRLLGKLPPPKKLLRQTDAIVQLAQKHGVAIFLSLHDWIPVELSDAELDIQRRWNRFWAERYRDVPGILYDVQNEPTVSLSQLPDLVRLYNAGLKARYGTPEALRKAWGPSAPPPDRKDWTLPPQAGTDDWADIKTLDANRFKVDVLNRWIEANVQGIKAGGPDALATVGYLQTLQAADKVLGVRHTDFSNMHYHGPLEPFPAQLKIVDRRFAGKGLSLGEFGAWEGHNARVGGQTGTMARDSVRRFLATTHWAFGLGASAVLNWDWKDFDDCVFPWGLNHHCGLVPKPDLYAYRNTSLFLERYRPQYQDPGVWLLLPDSNRLGARWGENHAALFRVIGELIAAHVDFNVANEYDLPAGGIPATCRAIIWPMPYCPEDATFQRVLAWVQGGGALYLSGDVSYDPLRQRTRTDRLAKLGLKDVNAPRPFDRPAGGSPPPVQHAQAGKGKVFYVPYPVELEGRAVGQVLREFLTFAGVGRVALAPDDPRLHAFTIPLDDGTLTFVCNRTARRQDAALADATLAVDADLTGMVVRRKDGRLVGVECSGRASAGNGAIADGEAHAMIQSLDGRDVRQATRLAVFPVTPGVLRLHTSAAWKSPVLEAGEFDGPAWRTLHTAPLAPADLPAGQAGKAFALRVDDDLARSILIVREKDAPPGLPRPKLADGR